MAVIAIAAAVGAITAFAGASSKNKAKRRQREAIKARERAALQALSPEAVAGAAKKYQPLFREQIAGGEGPLLKQGVSSSLARHGLTGTGVGEAIRGLSLSAPDHEAFRRALEKGWDTQLGIANTINARPIPDYMRENPYTAALGGAAQGAFGGMTGGMGGMMGGGQASAATNSSIVQSPFYQAMTPQARQPSIWDTYRYGM